MSKAQEGRCGWSKDELSVQAVLRTDVFAKKEKRSPRSPGAGLAPGVLVGAGLLLPAWSRYPTDTKNLMGTNTR